MKPAKQSLAGKLNYAPNMDMNINTVTKNNLRNKQKKSPQVSTWGLHVFTGFGYVIFPNPRSFGISPSL